MKLKTLTHKQLLFAKFYVIDGNITKAAIEAGCPEKNAGVLGSKMLKLAKVQQEVVKLREQRLAKIEIKHEVSRDRVLQELAKVAFSDMKFYVSGDNTLVDVGGLENEQSAAIASLEFTETPGLLGTIVKKKFSLWDKNKALEMLSKHFGLFEIDNNQKRVAIQINYTP